MAHDLGVSVNKIAERGADVLERDPNLPPHHQVRVAGIVRDDIVRAAADLRVAHREGGLRALVTPHDQLRELRSSTPTVRTTAVDGFEWS